MSGLILRLPTYTLPFVMGFIEWSLRRLLKEAAPVEFLPAAITSAALGLLASIVVIDLPQRNLSALSMLKQRVLRCVSGLSFVWLLFGLALWFELAAQAIDHDLVSSLPSFSPGGLRGPVAYSGVFYFVCLFLNEIKAGASS
jgi:hypothetical protein